MQEFLIFLPLPESLAPSIERFVRAGVAFLETTGQVGRETVGVYRRSTRSGSDVLHLVALSVSVGEPKEPDLSAARSLETVLRSALGAAKAPTSDVRVFVQVRAASESE